MSKRYVVSAILGMFAAFGATRCQEAAFAGGPPPCANCGNHAALLDPSAYDAGSCSHAPPCVDGCCIPNSQAYGFYPTQWRRWPVTQPPAPAPIGGGGISPPNLDLPPARDEISGPPVPVPTLAPGATGPAPGLTPNDQKPYQLKPSEPKSPTEVKSPSDSMTPSGPAGGLPESSGLLPGTLPQPGPLTLPNTSTPSTVPESTSPPSQSFPPPTELPSTTEPPSTTTPSTESGSQKPLPLPGLLNPPETPESPSPEPKAPDRSQTTPLGQPSKLGTATWTPACAGPSRDNPLREQARPVANDLNPLRGRNGTVASSTNNPVRPATDSSWTPAAAAQDQVTPVAHWEAASVPAKGTSRTNPLRTQ